MIITDEHDDDPSIRKPPSTPSRSSLVIASPGAGPSSPLLGAQQPPLSPYAAAASASNEPPPAYPGYQTFPQPEPTPPTLPPENLHSDRSRRDNKGPRRWWRVLFWAVFTYVLIVIIFRTIRGSGSRSDFPWDGDGWPIKLPGSSAYKVTRCDGFGYSSDPYTMSFSLEASAKELFLATQGDATKGNIEVVYDPQLHDTVDVRISINNLSRTKWDALKDVNICVFKAGDTAHGVLLHNNKDGSYFRKQADLNIVVAFPSLNAKPQSTPSFSVITSSYGLNVDLPAREVLLNRVNLRTQKSDIAVQSLSGVSISATTTRGNLTGSFIATSKVDLLNDAGQITANVVARHDGKGPATSVKMVTSEQTLTGTLSLESTTTTGQGGAFDVAVVATDTPVVLSHAAMPVGAQLNLKVAASNAPAMVHLDPAYEGSFSVFTTRATALVNRIRHDDPTGRGRQRSIAWDVVQSNLVKGSVYWGKERSSRGSADVRTTSGAAMLYV
ncbi:hypothetical protein K488DRAFT_87880 [Vararia minispora EC-137]|uniref:Uncharacterized protein n=1 Tax=Vararia minispora EC-137 TaxID=1314806 RepID=A0ACB8QER8_9AGAM|nr:hypothetical protein K488DRAFT_87880 [Vararia minispora EC-137]